MEPRSEAELRAILRARQLANQEKLRGRAEGMGRLGAVAALVVFLTLLIGAEIYFDKEMYRDIGYGVESLKSAGVDPKQIEAIRIVLLNISRHVASLIFLVAMLAGMFVVGAGAYLNGRMDATLKLMLDDVEPDSGANPAP